MNEYSLLSDKNLLNWMTDEARWCTEEKLRLNGQSLLGLNSGEAIIKILDMARVRELAWIGGVFWFNGHKTGGEGKIVQQRALISWDKAHESDFWDWTENEAHKLSKLWKVSKVAFGLSGRLYNSEDAQALEDRSRKRLKGVLYLPKGKNGDEIMLWHQPTKFMLYLDTDEKHDTSQLVKMCDALESPLLIADTFRGEHMICPFTFDGREYGEQIYEKIYAISLLASIDSGVQLDLRHYAYSLFLRERVIRVSEGLNGSPKPIISRIIWLTSLMDKFKLTKPGGQ